ncbi:hypothetical protein [Bacillus sp. Bos-x628]|uniref:hypothetical protein n=1 Tax=Bacillus maqinnsis TaxID=3229854 RepID=UPI00338EC921
MGELEFLQMISKESIVFVAIFVVYALFVKPKDEHIERKDMQISELMDLNRQIVDENSETLADISETMERISSELTSLNENQVKLKDGQDDLWKEIILIKRRGNNGLENDL